MASLPAFPVFPRLRSTAILIGWFCFFVLPTQAQFALQGPELKLNGVVFAMEAQADGKILLGGSYNGFNGGAGSGLMRLNADGTRDTTLDIGFVNGVDDLLVNGNYIYVAGHFTTVRTNSAGTLLRSYLFRMNLIGANAGKIDSGWVPVVSGPVSRLATDGTNLFIAGNFATVNGVPRTKLAKILISGATPDAVDPSWNPAPDNQVSDLEVRGSFLYVCGFFFNIGGLGNHYVARVALAGGGADSSWTPSADRPVTSLESDATFVYLGGKFSTINSAPRRGVARFNISGAGTVFDSVWNPDPNGEVTRMLKIGTNLYMSGVFTTVSAQPRFFMAKVPDSGGGTVDGTFLPNPNGAILDMVSAGGSLYAGGRFTTTVGVFSAGYAKLDPSTGAAGSGFAGTITTEGNAYRMEKLSDGKMMIGGAFDSVNGAQHIGIARVNQNGTLDASFQQDLYGYNPLVKDFKVDGTNLYFVGDFNKVSGNTLFNVARVNWSTGVLDTAWAPHPFTPLDCVETDANYVYIGSAGLVRVDNTNVANIARIGKGTPATVDSVWTPFVTLGGNPNTASVRDMVIDGADLIIGGLFSFIVNPTNVNDATQRISAARLQTTSWGTPVPGWSTQFLNRDGSTPAQIEKTLLFNSSLYVSGDFFYAGGFEQDFVAKLDRNTGALDPNFFPSPVDNDFVDDDNVRDIAGFGSHLYIGGNYQNISDGAHYVFSPYLNRVDQNTGAADLGWYTWTDASVDVLSFNNAELWMWGLYSEVLGQPRDHIAIVRPFTSAYQTWLANFFTPAQRTDSNYNATFLDLDLDGLTNLAEFAFNMNPFSASVSPIVAGTGTTGLPLIRSEIISGQRYLTVEYVRWKAAVNPGVDYAVQFADAITGPWSARGVTLSTTSIDANFERMKVRDSVANPAKVFGRVSLTPTTP